ncbi:ATP-binding protein [Alkanindiges illinoisensis]|uniref:ATP-binding protein n=1 Tax=Alkanindiges illinoisensis TaxID=197183 RepID=UPI00047934F3|nr:ATP-binding protein [Alkanindiges illinoisensis]
MSKVALVADTRPTKKYLVDGITKDITLEACIFDLIDNSIDAFQENKNEALPNNYKGYKIDIIFDKKSFSIKDIGEGIELNTLKQNALRFGSHPEHLNTSIGFFGIGLNRALLKLGKISKISTETLKQNSELFFDANKFINDDDYWDLPIVEKQLTGITGTEIVVQQLHKEIISDFSNPLWEQSFINSLAKRYSFFINRGLVITVNNTVTPKVLTSINKKCGFKKLSNTFEYEGVKVDIQLGQHKDFLFQYEQTEDKKNTITRDDCGWFVYCNGRAIKMHDWSSDTGWFTKAHTEHTGFIGIASFIGEGAKLPWNTSKSNLDLNNEIYKKALPIMKDFSEKWRTHTGKIKRGKKFFHSEQQLPLDKPLVNEIPPQFNLNLVVPDTKPIAKESSALLDDYSIPSTRLPDENYIPFEHIEHNNTPLTSIDNEINCNLQNQNELENDNETNQFTNSEFMLFEQNYSTPSHTLEHSYLFNEYNGKTPFNIPEDQNKLCSLLNELSRIKIDSDGGFPLASIFLIRCFIELSCKYYVTFKAPTLDVTKNNLGEQIKKCLDHMKTNGLLAGIDTRNIDSIYALCNENRNERTNRNIRYLQNTIHSPDLMWDKDSIKSFWLAIQPFLLKCYE